MNKNLNKIKDFIEQAGKLKNVLRYKGQKHWKSYKHPKRYESTADHSWRLSLMTLLASYEIPDFNFEKAVKYAILHDLVEVYAGDFPAHGKSGSGRTEDEAKYKKEMELKALNKLVGNLPKHISRDFIKLFHEYENKESFEAKLVAALDKIDGVATAVEYMPQEGLNTDHYEFAIQHGVMQSEITDFTRDLLKLFNKEFKKRSD